MLGREVLIRAGGRVQRGLGLLIGAQQQFGDVVGGLGQRSGHGFHLFDLAMPQHVRRRLQGGRGMVSGRYPDI